MSAADNTTQTATAAAEVLWLPEPGACGGRVDPVQRLVPVWLAELVDGHLQPSASPWASARMARTTCGHVDWSMVWASAPELFVRRAQLGSPPPADVWQARSVVAGWGLSLQVEVQFEDVGGELGLAIYGVGVVGVLSHQVWDEVAPLLTTCACTIREPRDDELVDPFGPVVPATAGGRYPVSTRVVPQGRWIGDFRHTWWSYPMAGPLRAGCTCAAHQPYRGFGPAGGGNPGAA